MKPLNTRIFSALLSMAASMVFAFTHSPTASAEIVRAVEYYHPAFEHYFVTANPTEIAALDAGVVKGWWRTGQRYRVDDSPGPDLAPVCRFFTAAYADKGTHFFTASASECAQVKTMSDWTYEGVAFYARLPDAQGNCAAGTATIHRFFNNGQGGAPNHAYKADVGEWSWVDRDGWAFEGAAYCAPLATTDTLAQTHILAGSTWDLPRTLSLDDNYPMTRIQFMPAVDTDWGITTIYFQQTINKEWGNAWWDPLSGAYILYAPSQGVTGLWALDDAVGPSTPVCTMWRVLNYVSLDPPTLHRFQKVLWSGREAQVAYRR